MSGGMIRLERRFDAPPKRVFRAWCDPKDLARWIWGSLGADVVAETDLRPGGRYRISTRAKDGSRWDFSGTYRVLEPPNRLVATLVWNAPMGYEPGEERIGVDIREDAGRTLMVFVHDEIPDTESRKAHAQGWSDSFDYLHRLLEGLP
jgi:uncharacterized protein YndB with AHSA1/START domain